MTRKILVATMILLGIVCGLSEQRAESQIRINEFVAKNVTGIQDPQSEYEDWIEILNTGTTTVDISGWYLSDKPGYLTKWTFPVGTTLQPSATLIIWADEDGKDGPYHAGFKLSADGESILLTAKDGTTVLDRVDFGPQSADVSTGRMEVDRSVWVTFPDPTPNARNLALPSGHLRYADRSAAMPAIQLTGSGTPKVGGTANYLVAAAPASTPGFIALSVAPAHLTLTGVGTLLVSPINIGLFPLKTDGAGGTPVNFPIPNVSALAGQSLHLQSYVHDGKTGGLSGGVVTTIGA